jgi:hypothetical protein
MKKTLDGKSLESSTSSINKSKSNLIDTCIASEIDLSNDASCDKKVLNKSGKMDIGGVDTEIKIKSNDEIRNISAVLYVLQKTPEEIVMDVSLEKDQPCGIDNKIDLIMNTSEIIYTQRPVKKSRKNRFKKVKFKSIEYRDQALGVKDTRKVLNGLHKENNPSAQETHEIHQVIQNILFEVIEDVSAGVESYTDDLQIGSLFDEINQEDNERTCTYCSKIFVDKYTRKTHERLHNEEINYGCCKCCDKFTSRQMKINEERSNPFENIFQRCGKTSDARLRSKCKPVLVSSLD